MDNFLENCPPNHIVCLLALFADNCLPNQQKPYHLSSHFYKLRHFMKSKTFVEDLIDGVGHESEAFVDTENERDLTDDDENEE